MPSEGPQVRENDTLGTEGGGLRLRVGTQAAECAG